MAELPKDFTKKLSMRGFKIIWFICGHVVKIKLTDWMNGEWMEWAWSQGIPPLVPHSDWGCSFCLYLFARFWFWVAHWTFDRPLPQLGPPQPPLQCWCRERGTVAMSATPFGHPSCVCLLTRPPCSHHILLLLFCLSINHWDTTDWILPGPHFDFLGVCVSLVTPLKLNTRLFLKPHYKDNNHLK